MISERRGWRAALREGLASELALFRKPKVLLAAGALVFVPALYVLIYVSSVWDPYGSLAELPVGLVNQDVALTHAGHEVAVGAQLVATLEKQKTFAFVRYETPEAARSAVEAGKVFFALLIPRDFSEYAAKAERPAPLAIYVSEGGNYTASILSKRFGLELAHTVNERLARERWSALVGDARQPGTTTLAEGLAALQSGGRQVAQGTAKLHAGSQRLRDGLVRAADGATALANGATQLAEGSGRLTRGMQQVENAIGTIRQKLPADDKLGELATGSATLQRGAVELKEGLGKLHEGAAKLEAGAGQLQDGAAKVPIFGGKLSAGAAQLRAGVVTLGAGIGQASDGGTRLSEGMTRLDAGVQPLANGLVELNAGLRVMSEKLPPSDQLDLLDLSMGKLREGNRALSTGLLELSGGALQLDTGAAELQRGASELAAGLDRATTQFQAGIGGSHVDQLAAPVTTVVEVVAPVSSNGPAFAPYFAALALWVGAVMMSFVFYLRRLPDTLQHAARPTRWLVKAGPLLALGSLQATVVVVVIGIVMKIPLAHPAAVWLVAVVGSFTFVTVVVSLIAILGDAGRLLAVVLLILQLAASGGVYPIQLSPSFYQAVHAYLPFTHLVRAFRAAMFSAFNGHWAAAVGTLLGFAFGAMVVGMSFARWKHVPRETYGPAVEF